MTRPEPDVALIETSSPSHTEYFFVAAGEHSVAVAAYDSGPKSHPEPRVHVFHRPYDFDMAPADDPPSAADDHNLLVQVWQLVGAQ